MYHISSTQSTL